MRKISYRGGMHLLFFYALCTLLVAGDELVAQAKLAIAQERYSYAYELISNKGELTEDSALILLEAGILSGAEVKRAQEALANAKNESVAGKRDFWLAILQLQQGEFGNALDQFNRLYQSNDTPYRDVVRRNIARIHLELGNPEEAASILGENISSENDQILYAQVLLKLGDFTQCRQILTEGKLADSEALSKNLLLAQLFFEEGKLSEAITLLEDAKVSPYSVTGRRAISFLSLLKSENGIKGSYDQMLSVLQNTKEVDPYKSYLDQLLLAAQEDDKPSEQVMGDLHVLRETWPVGLQPMLLYTIAQLQGDVKARITTLEQIFQDYPEHGMAPKVCFLAAQLGLQIEDEKERGITLQRIIDAAPVDSLKAKIYTWMAEASDGEQKLGFYSKALEVAPIEQISTLRLNHNLAEFYLPREKRSEFVLSSDQYVFYLYEQAISLLATDPEKAEELLLEFLRSAPEDERKGNAHLILAEFALKQKDPNLANEIKGHLETVDSIYQDSISDPMRYNLAKIQLALLVGDTRNLSSVTSGSKEDKAFLLKSGKLFYDRGELQLASAQFKKLESMELAKKEQDLVSLYLSLCYFKLNTEAHQQDALARLQKLSDSDGAFQHEAKLTLAQHFLDNASPEKSLSSLQGLPDSSSKSLIQARAYSLMKGADSRDKALEYYEALYRNKSIPMLQRYQIAHQYAQFLEQANLRAQEVELYYQIANFEVLAEPVDPSEWKLYETLCDRGVQLMEKLGQWRSAYNLAKIVNESNLPDRGYFLRKADEISLKNILWDDK